MKKEDMMKHLPIDAYGIMSTVREDGMPEARCIEFQFEENGKFYFATASNKEIYTQLVNNPKTAYTYMEPSGKTTVSCSVFSGSVLDGLSRLPLFVILFICSIEK